MSDFDTRFAQMRQLAHLRAESVCLSWKTDVQRIKEISIEMGDLGDPLGRAADGKCDMAGLYTGGEDLCALYAPGEHSHEVFAHAALDFLARELDVVAMPKIHNHIGLIHHYGPAVVDPLFDLLAGVGPYMSLQYRRLDTIDDDEESPTFDQPIFAPLDTADDRFTEAGIVTCNADDEHATLVTHLEIDGDAFAELSELIEERDALAQRVMRGMS